MWKKLTILIICLHLCLSMRLHLTTEFSEEAKELSNLIIAVVDEKEIDILIEATKQSNELTQEEKDKAHKCAETADPKEKYECVLNLIDSEKNLASSGEFIPTKEEESHHDKVSKELSLLLG